MKKLMSIKERLVIMSFLLILIAGILTGAALVSKVDDASETVKTELQKVEICRNPAKRSISVIEFETEAPTEATTEIMIETEATTAATAPETTAAPAVPLYTVDGVLLDPALQEYAYNTLCALEIGWYFPLFLCQMYQESRFNQAAVSAYDDYGLCQLKGKYHDYFKQLAGVPYADVVNDPFANIQVGAFLMAYYWHQCYDINLAISTYNTGSFDQYNADYVAQVRQWETTLQRK